MSGARLTPARGLLHGFHAARGCACMCRAQSGLAGCCSTSQHHNVSHSLLFHLHLAAQLMQQQPEEQQHGVADVASVTRALTNGGQQPILCWRTSVCTPPLAWDQKSITKYRNESEMYGAILT